MRMMVYVESSAVRGGIEVFAERHVAALRAAGHAVDVVSDRNPPRSMFADYDEIVVHKCGDVATLEAFPPEKTTLYVHDHEPICPRTHAYTPLGRNCTRPGALWPCIVCAPACRRWRDALGRVLTQGRRKRAMARFRRIVVISAFMKSRLVANGIPADRISVQPPEIPRPDLSGTPRSSRPSAHVDLLYVGQLVRGKGVHLLLRAMAGMKRRRTLDIVGTGNMEGRLKHLAAKLGLGDRIRFHGFCGNPQEWRAAAGCVVVASFWQEPFGLVAAEAVALGRNVVAFAIGGLPEACAGKATLVPPGDIAALAAALDRV